MQQSSRSSLISGFVLGAAATLVASVALRRVVDSSTKDRSSSRPSAPQTSLTSDKSINYISTVANGDSGASNASGNTREVKRNDLLDAPDLDLRLIRKAEAVIQMRSGTMTVVIERSTNSWNHSACLRTAEALGIQNVWIVDPAACQNDDSVLEEETTGNTMRDKKNRLLRLSTEEAEERRQHHLFARNATEWLSIREFETTTDCIKALRESGHQIYVTDLSQKAVELTPDDLQRHGRWPLPRKLAIVFGTEAVGCSEEMLNAADLRVYLPLRGFADSLNLSVAAALVVHHLLLLESSYVASMSEDERHELRKVWFPKLARQRLLSSRDKKRRRKLLSEISRSETLKVQHDTGVAMTADQLIKIEKLESYRKEVTELEQNAQFDASSQVVQDVIDNPPDPLSDLRRADAHRVTFAGKGIKRSNADYWKGLATVTGLHSEKMSTAGFFRERLAALVGGNMSAN